MQAIHEGNIFTARPEQLIDLLIGIAQHKITLPNFQRAWTWEPPMVQELLISVAYRYPAGSLLTMPIRSSDFALRSFEGTGELVNTDHPSLMVLDGQQRLTSLFQAVYSKDGVCVKGKTYRFYLDVDNLMTNTDANIIDFASALFFVKEEGNGKRARYEGLTPRYELTTPEQELAAGCLPLNYLFDANGVLADWKQKYLVQLSGGDMKRYLALDATWNQQIKQWLDNIRTYPFPIIELRADMPLGAICHIFEKVNSTGVPLDVFDLCTAIFWAKGFHLNEQWAKTRQRLESRGYLPMQPKPLAGTHFLQGIALLDSIDRKRKSPSERIAVTCRKERLMMLPVETVKQWWDKQLEGYKEASKFLASEGILSERILPYTTLLLPLSAMLADIINRKGHAHIGAAYPKISQWFWCSVFTQRYSSQLDTAAALDFEQVMSWVDGGDAPEVVRTFTFRADTLQEIKSIRNAIYKGILCLLAKNGAKDFGGGIALSVDLYHDTRQDHHHIFPTEALKQMGITDPRGDTIINKTLISASVNRSIGGKRPSQYTKRQADILTEATVNDILSTHEISMSYLKNDDWESFVGDRRERLRQLIVKACGGNVQPYQENDIQAIQTEIEDDEEAME